MQSFSHQNQPGFTLVELVVVIVLLGILSAIAIPKFTNMTDDAKLAATQGMAAVLGSASANNYSARLTLGTAQGGSVAACADIGISTVLQGGLPAGYTITGAFPTATSATVATCTVTGASTAAAPSGTTATFVGHRT